MRKLRRLVLLAMLALSAAVVVDNSRALGVQSAGQEQADTGVLVDRNARG